MSSLARPAVAVALVVGLAFACTNTIEGLPPEEDLAVGGTSAGASVVSGGVTGSTSGGMTNVGGSASPSGSVGGSGTAGVGGSNADPIGTGGASTGGASTGGTSTGGSGFAGSAQAGSGAGSFGGTPSTGNPTGGSTGIAGRGASGGSTGVAGSAPGSAGAPGGASGFAAVTTIITRTCATATCHGGRRNPNLSAANLYTTLTSTAVSECGNDRLVTAGDTANSAILQLVNGQCEDLLMPATCDAPPCLDAADMKTISDWIAAGAPR